MKHLVNYTFLFIFLTFQSFNPLKAQGNTAVEHMAQVIGSVDQLKDETWQYLKSVTHGKSARTVEKKRQELLAAIKTQKANANRMKGYQSDTRLRDAVATYLDLSYTVLKEDFDKILDMEDIKEQSYDYMEAYLLAREQANEKLDTAFQAVVKAQEAFAADHDIQLRDAETDAKLQKISKANEALKYYNDVYLVFFKSYKQDIYVIDALQREDVSGVEQNASALAGMAEEGQQQVKALPAYRGDNSLKQAATEALKFYQQAGEEFYPSLVDFYIKKDNLEKVRKVVEAKSKKDRTQEDIDQYNAASNEFNAAVNKYNATNQMLNDERSKQLKKWNEKNDQFFSAHAD